MRIIRHSIFVLAAIFALATNSIAQTYTLAPNDTFSVNALMEDLSTLGIQQLSITPDTLQLRWKKVSASFPANWDVSNCDNRICNTTLVDSGTMNPFIPPDYGLMLIHCTAHVNYGTAIIRYAVWDVNFPNLKDTLTYIINVNATGIAKNNFDAPSVWFAYNKIHLKGDIGKFEILRLTDISGHELFKKELNNQTEFELPISTASIYIIQLYGKEKQFQQKIFYHQ